MMQQPHNKRMQSTNIPPIMKPLKIIGLACAVIAALGLTSNGALAQSAEENKKDKTGTNPINFSNDLRIYNEYTELNIDGPGDGTQKLTTLEFRTPFADGKWQYRLSATYNSVEIDLDDDGSDDIDESGLGDWKMRILTVLSLDPKTKQGWAAGLEVFMDTADEDELGSGTTSLGPQFFWVQFFKGGLFGPGLQYKFSVDEESGRDEVEEYLIDLNYLKMADDKQSWFFMDPKLVFDQENDIDYAVVDLEWGWMMTNWNPEAKGQSFYVRPSFGCCSDRQTEGSIEVGYKWVGW